MRHELPAQRDHEEQEGTPLACERSGLFAQQLGQEWRAEEPGIYRFVGTGTGSPNAETSTDRPTVEASELTKTVDVHAPARPPDPLKRAALASAFEVLKAKRAHERPVDKERFAQRDEAVALKEKLASPGQPRGTRVRSHDVGPDQT